MTELGYFQAAIFGDRVCDGCGTLFEPKGNQRFCKPLCRNSEHPEQVAVTWQQVAQVREIVRLNAKCYWEQVAMKKRGACGAVAQVLYKHGWGRIASCWLSYTGNGKPPVHHSEDDEELDEVGPFDGWYFHWVNVNKFSGVVDVVGLPGRELCDPILKDLRLIERVREHMVDIVDDDGFRHHVRPRWPRRDLDYWERALGPALSS